MSCLGADRADLVKGRASPSLDGVASGCGMRWCQTAPGLPTHDGWIVAKDCTIPTSPGAVSWTSYGSGLGDHRDRDAETGHVEPEFRPLARRRRSREPAIPLLIEAGEIGRIAEDERAAHDLLD
jgi:hypothetical protein